MSDKFDYINILNVNWPHVQEELSDSEWLNLCLLGSFTVPKKCTLHLKGKEDEKAIYDVKDFCDVLEVSERTCRKIIKSLQNKEALVLMPESHEFIVNPYILLKGDKVDDKTFKFVENTRWHKYAQEEGWE